ncbi:hypothetical protein DDB_G0291766 [Dictyostelium discoideum AX4]|uniref:Uncharacterized protein n=1 Tax=Dictyostelium discoideum TaxID=44689 RepID=Q54E75_DICDI|nr:hypothetical protein DDB_G0291766 [Dictyostelium discoideum AX4]EAL61579.1 hypothetical protein DDB_G0291766 [Dictyostelium discoideum AX4]|eukprot:XP_629987.1 hypothetical protein DDB_G0291766 [Dictyostelium discoideum AX4]
MKSILFYFVLLIFLNNYVNGRISVSPEYLSSSDFNSNHLEQKLTSVYYNKPNCTEGNELYIKIIKGCNFRGRVVGNTTHYMFYDDDPETPLICSNFDKISEVVLKNTCINEIDGSSFLYKEYNNSDEQLLKKPGTMVTYIYPFKSCSENEFIIINFENVCEDINGQTARKITFDKSTLIYHNCSSECASCDPQLTTNIEKPQEKCFNQNNETIFTLTLFNQKEKNASAFDPSKNEGIILLQNFLFLVPMITILILFFF